MAAPAPLLPAHLELSAEGAPWSAAFGDVYHAHQGGLEQARHVFLAGNSLPRRWQDRDDFTILETGFGLGLSFLATWQAWRADPQRSRRLHFVSAELHPFRRGDLAQLHAAWPELTEFAAALRRAWPPLTPGFHHLLLDDGRVTLTLLFGDAQQLLPELRGQADAIYLDGFTPQRNPQLWSPGLLTAVTRHAAPGATLASWCVSSEVRAILAAAGWKLRRKKGYASKWHMLSGELSGAANAKATPRPRSAIVIGAGIAGCASAEALARRGLEVTLIERHAAPAAEASGNPVGLLHPMLARDDNAAARFSRAAYLYTLRLLEGLGFDAWRACGILELAADSEEEAEQARTVAKNALPEDYVAMVDRRRAAAHAGREVAHGGWWFPQAAWVDPRAFCDALLAACGERLQRRFDTDVRAVRRCDDGWQALDAGGAIIAQADAIVFANAAAAQTLLPDIELALRRIRGQISLIPAAAVTGLRTALCGAGYVTPAIAGLACVGASFVEDDADGALRTGEHEQNLHKLAALLPGAGGDLEAAALSGRVAFRTASQDRLPLIGTLPGAGIRPTHTLASLPRTAGLFALLGLGSRGLIWGPFGAELVAAQMCGEPIPLEAVLYRFLDPARYTLRKVRKAKS